jgi:hypothetical protein
LNTLKSQQTEISGLWAYRLINLIVFTEKGRKTKMQRMMMGKIPKKASKR